MPPQSPRVSVSYRQRLKKLLKPAGLKLNRSGTAISSHGGWPDSRLTGWVYAFWWDGNARNFCDQLRGNHARLHFLGPAGKRLDYRVTSESVNTAPNHLAPLYVGKTAGPIKKRIGLHLKLKTPRTVLQRHANGIGHRMTTSCQVRDRLDRLFQKETDTRNIVRSHVLLSWVQVDDFAERFYFENYAIGRLRPVFNVDTER
ncbi:MAG: hypothetical protein NTX53_06380 [candidate division WOR-3 bacterium]|nr:hypothetical protein [candidate division WOR-3 bacterium]